MSLTLMYSWKVLAHQPLKPIIQIVRPPCQWQGGLFIFCSAGTYAVGDLWNK